MSFTSRADRYGVSRAVQYMLLSTFCFTAMQSLVKLLPQFGYAQHIFFRSVIGWGLSVGCLLWAGVSLRGRNQTMLVVRGLVGSLSMFSFFYILTHIPFGSAVAFKYLSPIATAGFAVVMLGEKVARRQWLFYGITFVGVLLLKGFDPRISLFDMGIGLLSAVSGGLLAVIIRRIGDDDHPLVILHYFMAISAGLGGVIMLPDWQTPTLADTGWLLLTGLVGFWAQNLMTKAIQAPTEAVSFLAIIRYSEVIFALIIGYVVFDEGYTRQSILGIILVFTGLLLSFRRRQKQTIPTKPQPVTS
ncbi:DMT family transporter [Spirosoma rhododendri]|uniref:DMT family transporter n=1 Tax=Spirosoma rhododendri TaxID=2728024 RepID=A0A7L5DTU1_9BACT|nr:DMT family transporter [Spirosoma rhododendri]QJD80713.1 DMT family transporter [Spirosoma rhododendri]